MKVNATAITKFSFSFPLSHTQCDHLRNQTIFQLLWLLESGSIKCESVKFFKQTHPQINFPFHILTLHYQSKGKHAQIAYN